MNFIFVFYNGNPTKYTPRAKTGNMAIQKIKAPLFFITIFE